MKRETSTQLFHRVLLTICLLAPLGAAARQASSIAPPDALSENVIALTRHSLGNWSSSGMPARSKRRASSAPLRPGARRPGTMSCCWFGIERPPGGFEAYLVEAELTNAAGHSYKLSTEARVIPDGPPARAEQKTKDGKREKGKG